MSKRIQIADVKDADEESQDLRNLLEKYLKRSEELEEREGRVLKQIELMQSAVSSLQAWNESRKTSTASLDSVHIDVKEIEEETRLIREETRRIQIEIEQKIEENRMLEEEIQRRKMRRSETQNALEASGHLKKKREMTAVKKKENPETRKGINVTEQGSDVGVDFFNEKLRKLKEMDRKLKRESEMMAEEARKRQKSLQEKIEILEWETDINKQLVSALRKGPESSKK